MSGGRYDVLIVGAGHGGAQAAVSLRQRGFAGSIAIVGDEPDLPYDRPALSKDYLAGDKPLERLLIRPAAFWTERDVAMLLGRRVTAVDAGERVATLADGARLGFGDLIWAAGGAPRRLTCSGHDLRGVHAIRTRADVDRLRAELDGVAQAIVIGGGYIGLEAAAVLTGLGKRVTVLEAQDRVLARVAGVALSRFYEAEHRARGVDVRLGVTVSCIEERDGAAAGVRLADGTMLAGEMVIVGIGIEPAIAPLAAAGAAVHGNGVLVDAQCRTTLPHAYAIGDGAAHANPHAGGAIVRLESVQNATDQAKVAAQTIAGEPAAYAALPWFWSNQYDLKLQTIGLSTGHDETILRGDPAARAFTLVYLRDGSVIALDCVNRVKDYVQGRALIGHIAPARDRLADAAVPLAALVDQGGA